MAVTWSKLVFKKFVVRLSQPMVALLARGPLPVGNDSSKLNEMKWSRLHVLTRNAVLASASYPTVQLMLNAQLAL